MKNKETTHETIILVLAGAAGDRQIRCRDIKAVGLAKNKIREEL